MASLTVGKLGSTLAGSVALASTVLAAAAVWLILTDPGAVASALAQGSPELLLRSLLKTIGAAVGRLFGWM